MLTEKALRDSVFCPTLWGESEKADMRLKNTPRSIGPRNIVRAMSEEKSNKNVTIDFTDEGMKASSTKEGADMWITTNINSVFLLLSVRDVLLDVNDVLMVRRLLWREPTYTETVELEIQIQRMLWLTFSVFFEGYTVVVESMARDCPRSLILDREPSEDDVEEMQDFVTEVSDLASGESSRTPNHSNCVWCKWEGCTERRVGSPEDQLRQRGIPRPGVL